MSRGFDEPCAEQRDYRERDDVILLKIDPGRIALDLSDDPLGLLSLNLGRLDDVFRRLDRSALATPEMKVEIEATARRGSA